MGHIRWHVARGFGGLARPAFADSILSNDSERIIAPWGEGYPLMVSVHCQLRLGLKLPAGTKRSVVFNDELENGRVVPAEELPRQVGDAVTALDEFYTHRWVRDVWKQNLKRLMSTARVSVQNELSVLKWIAFLVVIINSPPPQVSFAKYSALGHHAASTWCTYIVLTYLSWKRHQQDLFWMLTKTLHQISAV